jgi:hypothetical protein
MRLVGSAEMSALWDKDRRRAKKLARELASSAPDGTEYVVVPMERTESWSLMLCQKAADRVENPVPHWVYLAQVGSFSNTVRKVRGEENAEGTRGQTEAALVAAKLGYQLRVVEFEDLGEEDSNAELTKTMLQMVDEDNAGEGWFPNVCGTAAMLMNASLEAPYDPGIASYLEPVGAGHDIHAAMCASMVEWVTPPEGVDLAGISVEDLAYAWRYGYYLRACEMSLPDIARDDLAEARA